MPNHLVLERRRNEGATKRKQQDRKQRLIGLIGMAIDAKMARIDPNQPDRVARTALLGRNRGLWKVGSYNCTYSTGRYWLYVDRNENLYVLYQFNQGDPMPTRRPVLCKLEKQSIDTLSRIHTALD